MCSVRNALYHAAEIASSGCSGTAYTAAAQPWASGIWPGRFAGTAPCSFSDLEGDRGSSSC